MKRVLPSVLLSGCAAAHMRLPADFDGNSMEVEGRSALFREKNPLRFGPFEASEIDRSWTRGRSADLGAVEMSEARQTYTFELRQGKELAYEVSCGAERADTDVTIQETPEGSTSVGINEVDALTCTFDAPRGGEDWTMEVLGVSQLGDRTLADPMRGTLSSADRTLVVEGVNGLADTRIPYEETTGYVLREGREVLVAVDVMSRGTVWVAPEAADDGATLAAAAAALLLYPDLEY